MQRFLRRSWDALWAFGESRLAGVTHDFWFDWPRFLRWSGLVALGLVATMHVVQATTIPRGGSLGLAVVLVAALVATVLLALQGWTLWQTQLDATKRQPYVMAVLLLAVTVSVSTEAFAGVTLWFTRNGWTVAHEASPSLWTAERMYLWHLVDSVPLVSATKTLGWAEPLAFSGPASGALILLFKITLILPLARLAVAGYELVEAANDKAIERAEERLRRGGSKRFGDEGDFGALALFLFVATAVIGASMYFVFDPSWFVNRWMLAHLEPGLSVGRVHLPLTWLYTVPQWVATLALIYFTGMMADFLSLESDSTFKSLAGVVGGVSTYLAMLCLLTLVGVAISLTLLHVGLVRTQTPIPPHAQVWATIDAYTRSIADAIPGLDVPARLEWTLTYPFVGIVQGVLFLLYRITFLAVLLLPITRIVRSFVRRLRPRTIVPTVTAAGEFIALLRTTQAKLDELERYTLAKRDEKKQPTAPLMRRRLRPFAFERPPVTLLDIDNLIAQLEEAFARVTSLFGEGEILTCADAALAVVVRSRDHVHDLTWRYNTRHEEEAKLGLSTARSDLKEKTEDFSELASAAFTQQGAAR